MPNKPKSERIDDRQTEDEIAQAALGGPRGSAKLKPAKPERKTKLRGVARVAGTFMLNLIAYNLVRIPKMVAI